MKRFQFLTFVLLVGVLLPLTQSLQHGSGDYVEALRHAKKMLRKNARRGAKLLGLNVNSVPFGPQVSETSGEFILYYMQSICKNGCSAQDIADLLQDELFDDLALHCRQEVNCSNISPQYRTIDGVCNNLMPGKSLYGSINTPLGRFLDPVYNDGISEPRVKSETGSLLNSPRKISELVMPDVQILDNGFTTMMVYFGQLMAHDFIQTPTIKLDGKDVPCCKKKSLKFDGCIPIDVSKCDCFYNQFSVECMNLIRSKATVSMDCTFDVRQQENKITTFIDASFLYGSETAQAIDLRQMVDGLMKVTDSDLLPIIMADGCMAVTQNCNFKTGDSRVNENVALTILHTVFLREHNRIAQVIKSLGGTLTDEEIYQKTRKIMAAMTQSITYREYVPIVVGSALVSSHNLQIGNTPDTTVYDPAVSPAILNAFTTAAFRFGHSTIATQLNINYLNGTNDAIPLKDSFLAPFQAYDDNLFDGLSKGLTTQCPRQSSVFLSSSISKQLNNKGGAASFGDDLGAINIQRGRDHGLPPYNAFRTFCSLPAFSDFLDIPDIGPATLANLRKVYDHVNDIDLFVGGLLEKPVSGGAVGPTFGCLIAKQFDNLKAGDRYFFTNGRSIGNGDSPNLVGDDYTAEQITEINKASLARLFCDHTNINMIQPRIMEKIQTGSNEVVDCSSIPEIDISIL